MSAIGFDRQVLVNLRACEAIPIGNRTSYLLAFSGKLHNRRSRSRVSRL
ncbi:hypothetical protein QT970_11500 [Microcoleus sp. herbarium8]